VDNLLGHDSFMLVADYADYLACQENVGALWRDPAAWSRMSILNVARMGHFSSDRSIGEYCQKIWHIRPVIVKKHVKQRLNTRIKIEL
jgi:glycogen phosphorylase